MKRILLFTILTCFLSNVALAGNGNGAPTGAHYNLNIIGVEKGKESNMTGSNRHTIFMPLVTKSKGIRSRDPAGDGGGAVEIHSQIWLTPGDRFRVCDGNGFDLAYGCPDNAFTFDPDWNGTADCWVGGVWEECEIGEIASRKEGAVFELPCNNSITDDQVGFIECDFDLPQSSYTVWARALGSPKNEPMVSLTTCATVQDELQCSTENVVKTRTKGKSSFTNVTDELTSAVVDYCTLVDATTGDCLVWETTRIALFSGETEDWFWNYVNNGVRLLQLRFYEAD